MITCHPLKECGGVCICRDPALCLDFPGCVVFCCVYNVSGWDTHAQPVTAQGWDYKNLYLLPLCELQFGQNEVCTFNTLKFQPLKHTDLFQHDPCIISREIIQLLKNTLSGSNNESKRKFQASSLYPGSAPKVNAGYSGPSSNQVALKSIK